MPAIPKTNGMIDCSGFSLIGLRTFSLRPPTSSAVASASPLQTTWPFAAQIASIWAYRWRIEEKYPSQSSGLRPTAAMMSPRPQFRFHTEPAPPRGIPRIPSAMSPTLPPP